MAICSGLELHIAKCSLFVVLSRFRLRGCRYIQCVDGSDGILSIRFARGRGSDCGFLSFAMA